MAGPTNLSLTVRDYKILTTLATVPFLSSLEIEMLFFPPRNGSRAEKYSAPRRIRLRKMVEKGYLLSPPRSDSKEPLLYALTVAGAKLVQAKQRLQPDEISSFKPGNLPEARLTHYRIIAEFYTALRLMLQNSATIELGQYIGERFLNAPGQYDRMPSASGKLNPLVPDGLAILHRKTDQKRRFIFLEADTGTETLRIIKGKIEAYADYRIGIGRQLFRQRYNAEPAFRTIFVTQSARRLTNMRHTMYDALKRKGVPIYANYFLFFTRDELKTDEFRRLVSSQ